MRYGDELLDPPAIKLRQVAQVHVLIPRNVGSFVAERNARETVLKGPGAESKAQVAVASRPYTPTMGLFSGICMCRPPTTHGMDARAGWQYWICPSCGAWFDLEHYWHEDGR